MKTRTSSIIGLLLAATACSSSEEWRGDMSSILGDVAVRLGEMRELTVKHEAAVASSDCLEAIESAEGFYRTAIDVQIERLHHDMLDMSFRCTDWAGHPPEMGTFKAALDGMRAECDEHLAEMGSAADMPAAHREEAEHQAAMKTMLDAMDGMQQSMMEDANGFTCIGEGPMGTMHALRRSSAPR